jgi:energy-coupling factor transport system ATP-binding protein
MIELEHVSYVGRDLEKPLLNELSFLIPAGQWVSIIGKNGCGKSTLVKLLNRLLPSSGGHIVIDGEELTNKSVGDIREQIGMVFPNPDNQFVGMTVTDDIVFGLENRCLDRATMQERVAHYADRLQITHLLERHPNQLSGGQKQRVALAAVLAMEPKIVIFDEATSMLDEKSKRDMIQIMHDMKSSGQYTLISVTHDYDEINATDRVLALVDGAIAADCRPHDIWMQDELLESCGLKPSFIVQLGRALQHRGIDLGPHLDEREVVDALWELSSRASAIRIAITEA